jgi:hypothetical protein
LTEKPGPPKYRLLTEFRRLFEGRLYKHRASNQGDFVAMHLYEDLVAINRSVKLIDAAVNRKDRVLNVHNKRRGVTARRGDGTFGEIIPGETPIIDPGYLVARGSIATVEIGVEVKVLAKAMIKQIDRVINDLRNQVAQFKRGGGHPICVAVVASTAPITRSDMRVTGHSLPRARLVFCIRFRKRLPQSAGYAIRLRRNSMSS